MTTPDDASWAVEGQASPAPVRQNGYLYWVTKAVLGPVVSLVLRPRVEGRANVPATGPVIFASNHTSFYDWLVLPHVVRRRRIIFLTKAEYFTGRGVKGRLRRFFFTACGQVPVQRSGGRAGDAALLTAVRLLAEGKALGVFPEGTRSPDGRLHRGRTGLARIAAASGAPVVPCATIGLFEVAPAGRVFPRFVRARTVVRFGPPMSWPSAPGAPAPDGAVLRRRTDEVMHAIQQLSGQEYSGQDARYRPGGRPES